MVIIFILSVCLFSMSAIGFFSSSMIHNSVASHCKIICIWRIDFSSSFHFCSQWLWMWRILGQQKTGIFFVDTLLLLVDFWNSFYYFTHFHSFFIFHFLFFHTLYIYFFYFLFIVYMFFIFIWLFLFCIFIFLSF